MENRKLVKFVVPALLLGLFVNSPHVLAYGVETHAALTTNIFDFYNQSFPDKKLPEELKNFLIDGSRHEDSAPRWMNHFYDPVKDRGLESVYGDGYKSKEWAASKDKQNEARYKIATALASLLTIVEQKKISAFTTETDFTWERAIRFWVNGDKEKAMYILGHILHLIEDASVPDHTRNDAHPGFAEDKSPYENFTQNPEIYNKDASTKLKGKSSVKLATLAEYFEGIAKYSNNNFFSKNTIRRGYEKPGVDLIETEKDGKYIYAFLRDSDGVRFRGVAYLNPNAAQRSWALDPELSLEDGQGYLVLGDYWNLLSVKSIQHGAGVIDLFFKEVEKAKNDPNFVREEKTMLGQIVGAVSGLYDKTKTLLADTWQRATGTSAPNAIEIPLGENAAAPTSEQEAASASQLATTDSANTAPQGTVPAKQNTTPSTSSAPTTTTQNIAPSQSPTLRTAAPSTPQDQKVVTAPKTAETSQTATAPTPKQCSFTQGGSPSHQSAILNEIAWMGTVTSANDEWMELKNISSAILDISGWQLLDQGEQIKVVFLPGTKILAGGYLLLERTNDFSVPNIAADLIYSGALSNTSEGLRLFNSQCALIDEVLASPDWPAGNAADRLTMERDLSGFSWHNTTRYGGTPRRENSAPAPAVPTGGSGGSSSAPATTAPASNADNSSTNTVSTSTPELPSPPTSTSTPPTSSTVPAAMHVVISEIAAGIDGNPDYEFIELYNPTTTTVELTGWSIKKKSSTGSESSLLVASRLEGKVILPNHYFLTANEEGYTGSLAPDIRWAKSNTLAYTNNAVTLYDASSARVDEASWIEIPKGKSWERKAVSGETCVSAQNAGEYLGNGCDTDSASDFEIRNTPNPQNAQSLPEPRAAAQIQNPSVSYSSSTMELVFNWGSSADAAGATSTVAYEIQEYNSPGVPIFNAMSTTGFRKLIDEVGREYHFSLQTFDREGLGSATSTLDVAIPSFMESAAWYENPAATGSYRLEARYGRYPFIPGIWQGPAQKIIVAYLNEAASKIPINLATRTGMQLNAATNPALFRYRNCVGSDTPTSLLFLPDNAEWCSGISGDVRLNALPFGELEDLHLHVDIHPRETPFTTTDYLTFAFYAGSDSFGGNQGFSLVAVDATKYFLNPEPPAHQPPSAPSDLELSATNNDFTGISGILASFTPSNDPDSLDWRLRYELSTAGSTWQTLDLGGGPDPNKKYGGVSLPMGNTYTISIRSVDETGLISPVVAQDITIPAAPPGCPAATGNAYYAIDCIRLHDGLVEIRWRLLTNSPVSGATFGINPYLSSTTPSYANRALHKDINGNSPYSNSTANAGGDCSRSFTPVEQYELNRQYRTTFPSIGVVPATDITATSTLKFAIFRGTPCLISDLFWDDPQEYAISTP